MKLSPELKSRLEAEIERQALPPSYLQTVERWLLPVADHLRQLQQAKGGMLLVSFNGSQGSGKSTITRFLTLLLRRQFDLNTIDISIDDFYLTRAQRQQLAEQVHPLFSTRGVPGTHDLELACATLEGLAQAAPSRPCALPRFDKASDDRAPRETWPSVDRPVDIVLFEGWCNHAPAQDELQLIPPVNELEQNEDGSMVWRRYANDQLREYHRKLFSRADALVHLRIPYFEIVYEWRGLQEKKLAASNPANASAVMDEAALRRFIQHYERITRACLTTLPAQAQVVLELNADHQIENLRFNGSPAPTD